MRSEKQTQRLVRGQGRLIQYWADLFQAVVVREDGKHRAAVRVDIGIDMDDIDAIAVQQSGVTQFTRMRCERD